MSNSILLLEKILPFLKQYENERNNSDLKEFSTYMNENILGFDSENDNTRIEISDFKDVKKYPEVEFSTLITNLYRFAKHYSKKAFATTSIRTIEEFGFLASLFKEQNLLKNELINRHLIEPSSGSEILKRLIKNGLVEEYPDENDKRSKRVMLTKNGNFEIITAFIEMGKVSSIVSGNITKSELYSALTILNKLNYFHHQIHECDKNTSLDELNKKYKKT